jgi:hypothetical protein
MVNIQTQSKNFFNKAIASVVLAGKPPAGRGLATGGVSARMAASQPELSF